MLRDDSLKRLKREQQDPMKGIIRPDSIERQLMPAFDDLDYNGLNDEITPLHDFDDHMGH